MFDPEQLWKAVADGLTSFLVGTIFYYILLILSHYGIIEI